MPAAISTAGFTPQENTILLDDTISIEAKSTHNLLKFFDRGRGCFAKKETLCRFLKISTHRLRKALRELEARRLIVIQRRGQGKTDIIWVVREQATPELPEPMPPPLFDDAPLPDAAVLSDDESLTATEIAPDAPEEPAGAAEPVSPASDDLIDDEPALFDDAPLPDDALLAADESLTVTDLEPDAPEEPAQAAEPVSPASDNLVDEEPAPDPESTEVKIQTLKCVPLEVDVPEENPTTNTPSTVPDTLAPPDSSIPKESAAKEIINYFFQIKEQRPASTTETHHWSATADPLLKDFTVEEIKEAIDFAVNHQQARLFYFIGLSAPSYIHGQRKKKEHDLKELKKQELQQQQQQKEKERQGQREERRKKNPYKAETQALLDALSQNMRPQSFTVWFAESFIEDIREDYMILNVASESIADFIGEKYMPLLREITGKQVKFDVS